MRRPFPSPGNILAAGCALAFACTSEAEVHVLDFEKTPAAGLLSVADIPERSGTGHVIDETGSLVSELLLKTETALRRRPGAPTYLVIKDGGLPTSTDAYGNELLRRWITGGGRLGALVLSVSEPLPATHVVLAGRDLNSTDRQRLRDLGAAALALSATKGDPAEGAAATALGLAEALATFATAYHDSIIAPTPTPDAGAAGSPQGADAAKPAPPGKPNTTSHWDILSAKLDWPLIRAVSLAVGGITLLIAGMLILPRLLGNRSLHFPEHEPRKRFSAPYAGGSNAQIRYRDPQLAPPPDRV